MAGEFFGFDLSNLSAMGVPGMPSVSQSQQTQQSAVAGADAKDIKGILKDSAEALKKLGETLKQESLSPELRTTTQESLKFRRQETKEILKEFFTDEGASSSQAGRWSNSMTGKLEIGQINDFDNELKEVTDSLRNMGRVQNNWMQTLLGGGSGAAIVKGFTSGSPMAVIGGLGGLISHQRQVGINYRKNKVLSELEDSDVNPMLEAIKESAVPILAGLGALASEVFQQANSRVDAASNFFDIAAVTQRGGTQMSSQEMLKGGRIGENRVLTPSQVSAYTKTFGDTGGGSAEEFKKGMDAFTRNTVLYGEAAMKMLAATRDLEMWVPSGDFSSIMEGYGRRQEQKGVPVQLMQESYQALLTAGREMAKRGGSQEDIKKLFSENQDYLSTKLGMHGSWGVQATKGVGSFAKEAVSDPSRYAFLSSMGISNQDIFALADGSKTFRTLMDEDPDLLNRMTEGFRVRLKSTKKYSHRLQMQRVFKDDATAQMVYSNMYPDEVEKLQAKKNEISADNQQADKSILAEAVGGRRDLIFEEVLSGFSVRMQETAKAITAFSVVGEKLFKEMSLFTRGMNAAIGFTEKILPGDQFGTKDIGWGKQKMGTLGAFIKPVININGSDISGKSSNE